MGPAGDLGAHQRIFGMKHIRVYFRFELIHEDPDDNKFISCAIDGQCYYIVSGDKDLLTLKEYSDVKIVTVAEFFELMNA